MDQTKKAWVVAAVLLIVGLAGGYWFGSYQAYDKGYEKAVADAKATQEEVARNAAADAAKAANPFQTTNPLQGVDANPFEQAAKVLNPFSQ